MIIMNRILFFIFSVFTLTYANQPKLLLYFDINQTIIASDPSGNRNIESVINHSLAQRYKDLWDNKITIKKSYYNYVFEDLLPGTRKDRQLKSKRTKILKNFVNYLKETGSIFYPEAEELFHQCFEKINSSNAMIFQSFYKLIDYLNEKNIPYSIIIRTFGKDIQKVTEEIEKNTSISFSKDKYNITDNQLFINDSLIYNDMASIYHFFVKSNHLAIQDNWYKWNQNEEISEFGKKFPINFKDNNTISLFFDDHVEEDYNSFHNIVAPIDVDTNNLLDVHSLVKKKLIFKVNTVDAILDDYYFIKKVKEALN